ncbi:chromate reductase [Filimonas zeae]|uniref:NADPH-dependent FMN reductase-like domain-containing protein n=1 Tax=Filimonas zeae TaxID=1737353 RepID=A0A917MZ81_9BACT|nr:NAD(P)H-dependent oxidoreductase [Filimonas zeae]MDR6342915.1 chromate reductase [Filimonas zeae]GGH83216.1 hypothetical protein GCM10011379_58270 [Filimonas zeae]
MKTGKCNILIINGSVRGSMGNTAKMAQWAYNSLQNRPGVTSTVLTLSEPLPAVEEVYRLLTEQDAFLVLTGVYWHSWGSPLQRFIEVVTAFEHSPAFSGKPVACGASMDSVGGAELVARLLNVFSGLGCWSPPCSSLLVSRVAQEAIAASAGKEEDENDDVWRMEDMEVVLENLIIAACLKPEWKEWPHRKLAVPEGEWPATGNLDLESPRFL